MYVIEFQDFSTTYIFIKYKFIINHPSCSKETMPTFKENKL